LSVTIFEEMNSSFDLVFRTSSITNYAALDGAIRGPLSALTVAMWLRTDDRDNQGTPLSYATSNQFNGWALTDSSGFVLYIDGVQTVTDVAVNDGRWHHITVTWYGATTGAWTIYVDGLSRANGTIKGSNGVIEGSVTLLITH
jgi:CUB/sushi domain-containing protein